MNAGTRKVLKRLERMAERESLPSIGPIKGKVIADVIQDGSCLLTILLKCMSCPSGHTYVCH